MSFFHSLVPDDILLPYIVSLETKDIDKDMEKGAHLEEEMSKMKFWHCEILSQQHATRDSKWSEGLIFERSRWSLKLI